MIDCGETPHPFYITRYYERGTLQDLMRAGFGDEMYPKIFLQLLLGLRELHKRGFAHRDLKEENVLVDNDLTLIIGDPDFMKSEKDHVLKTFLGTPLYAAPEIWPGRSRSYGVSADIWSLAICILHLFYDLQWPSDPLPGHYEADKPEDWITKWCNAVFEHLDEQDENNQIIDILKRMLKLEPESRSTVDQCLQRGCENGLFRQNRFGDIVLAEATEVDTEVNPVPTSELPEHISGCGEGERTPTAHSRSTSESQSSRRPARRLKVSSGNGSEWSHTVDLECSSYESGFPLEDQSTKDSKEDLSKLRITKRTFSSGVGSSFSSQERGGSLNEDFLAC